jgi:hypothetical protein
MPIPGPPPLPDDGTESVVGPIHPKAMPVILTVPTRLPQRANVN